LLNSNSHFVDSAVNQRIIAWFDPYLLTKTIYRVHCYTVSLYAERASDVYLRKL